MFKRDFLAFAIIFLLAAFLRLYALAIVPPAPSLDEVSIGYNAYSILYTGTDEYGYRLPLLLRAYDDWRPALYVYLVIPFVKFMGLSSLAVRFPSIILSLLAVWMLYRIGKLLSRFNTRLHYLGEVSALLLTISPWHIYISRLGHEANLGLTLTIAGIYMLFVFILEKSHGHLSLWLRGLDFPFMDIRVKTYCARVTFKRRTFVWEAVVEGVENFIFQYRLI